MTVCNNYNCDTCNPPLPKRRCDCCGGSLKFVDSNKFEQYDNALHIYLYGGYGEYIDERPLESVICGGCASEIREKNPWLFTNWQAGD